LLEERRQIARMDAMKRLVFRDRTVLGRFGVIHLCE
jgi:hypothetical protein